MTYIGDFRINNIIRHMWNSNAIAGESITRATNGTISVYKDGGTTQSTAGVTDTEDFDGLTGVHLVAVDTTADGTFYSAGSDFIVVLSGATIDGKTINAVLFSFSLENRSALMPTLAGRKLDVSSGGEAGLDWANIGSPTGSTPDVNLVSCGASAIGSGAFASGAIHATAIASDALRNDAFANGAITAAKLAADCITAAKVAADVSAEVADAVWDEVLSGHATAGTMGAALSAAGSAGDPWSTSLPGAYGAGTAGKIVGDSLDAAISSRASQTSLNTLDDYVDSEIAAIKAKTDNLPASPAATGDIPTANANAAALLDLTDGVETGLTVRGSLRVLVATAAGTATGGGGTSIVFKNPAGSTNRVTLAVDTDGNRSSCTLNV